MAAPMLIVAALYHFTRFEEPATLRGPLLDLCNENGLRGTLLLAREGINGTIAGHRAGIDALLAHIRALPGCATLDWKESAAVAMPFARMKVRLKREIVTMGQPDVDPTTSVGRYVEPADWNELISAPDVAVIDTRNDYEVQIGSFRGAVDPQTRTFRDFPAWWEKNAHRFHNKRVAMFCTGGIRCEKSTNYLLSQGVGDVFHLKRGILKYLEDVRPEDSLWQGECFVFDQRVSLTHGLKPGRHGSQPAAITSRNAAPNRSTCRSPIPCMRASASTEPGRICATRRRVEGEQDRGFSVPCSPRVNRA